MPFHAHLSGHSTRTLRLSLLALGALCIGTLTNAQQPPPKAEQDALLAQVTALDTRLFDAYNHCDLNTLGAIVSDDLEFYHDQTGLAVGRQPFLDAMQHNICGKVERVIVPGTLEAHPLKGYGALEIVTHRFHHADDPHDIGGEARSIMLWHNVNGSWVLARVISYDHHSL
jgi:hypothetical protein